MAHEFTEAEADRHNELTKRGWALLEGEIALDEEGADPDSGAPDRVKLADAIRCFEQALEIDSEGWSSMWALGKIHQQLEDHRASLEWFTKAHEINPTYPDVAREAGLAAMDCGEAAVAVSFCTAAVEIDPDDPGLVANLALAHMLAGDDAAAVKHACSAALSDPADEVSKAVLELVQDIAQGKQVRPKTLSEAFPE